MTQEETKQLEGLKAKLLEYKVLLRKYRREERSNRDLRKIALQWGTHAERIADKLDKAMWWIANYGETSTVEQIQTYVTKVRKGLGLE